MKYYAILSGNIRVTKKQYDTIMSNQNKDISISKSLLLMGLITKQDLINKHLSNNNKIYSQYDINNKIQDIEKFCNENNIK